jgi:hypothetical protein
VLETAPFARGDSFCPATSCGAVLRPKGSLVLAVSTLSHGWTTILYLIAVLLFLAGFFGFKPGTQRVRLDSLGLAVFVFVFFWNEWALT